MNPRGHRPEEPRWWTVTGDLVSAERETCCPSARKNLSAYPEYLLSVVTHGVSHAGENARDDIRRSANDSTTRRRPPVNPCGWTGMLSGSVIEKTVDIDDEETMGQKG